jgi:hypothetical protein
MRLRGRCLVSRQSMRHKGSVRSHYRRGRAQGSAGQHSGGSAPLVGRSVGHDGQARAGRTRSPSPSAGGQPSPTKRGSSARGTLTIAAWARFRARMMASSSMGSSAEAKTRSVTRSTATTLPSYPSTCSTRPDMPFRLPVHDPHDQQPIRPTLESGRAPGPCSEAPRRTRCFPKPRSGNLSTGQDWVGCTPRCERTASKLC